MSNDDYSRHLGPTGPHAPHVPEGAPGTRQSWMKPGSSDPGLIGADADPGPGGTAGGSGSGIGVALMAMAGFFAADKVAVPILVCLYPLGGGAAIAAGFISYRLVNMFAPPTLEYGTRMVIAAIGACIVWWPASRREQRFGEITSYRRMRHVARLVLLAGFAFFLTASRPFGPLPASLRPDHVFTAQEQVAIVAGTVILAHIILTRGSTLRLWWYMALESLGLRAG